MKVSSNLFITEREITKYFGQSLADVQDSLTLPNPEYANIMRFGGGRFYKKVPSHICYLQTQGVGSLTYILPRYFFGELSSDLVYTSEVNVGRPLTSETTISLRGYQREFLEKNAKAIDNSTGILLEAPCGHGKTILGIWLSYLRYVQTLVLVPTYYLAKQWKQRIKETTNASVYVVTSKDSAIPLDSDFTIVCMDLFSVRTLPEDFVQNVGHVILDEAHRVGADTYMPILDQIPARYRTALTATFRRSDGVHRILKYHFGTHIQMENRFPKPRVFSIATDVSVECCLSKNKPYQKFLSFMDANGFEYKETAKTIAFPKDYPYEETAATQYAAGSMNKATYNEISACLRRGKELSYSVVESYLNENSYRRKRVISLIKRCLDAGRTVLFLSKRKDILRVLYKYFAEYKPMLIVSETNNLSEAEEKYLQESCPLILGVTQLAKEGLDVDRLDTLIVYLPLKDLEQAVGRISRLHPKKKDPIAFYMLDNCPLTWATFTNAKRMMKNYAQYVDGRTLQTISTIL